MPLEFAIVQAPFLLEHQMVTQCISAVCTLGLIVLAMLIMTRAISLEGALKAIGKALLVLLIVLFAVCALGSRLFAGVTALALLVETAIRWLVVTVLVMVLVIVFVRALLWKFWRRTNSDSNRD